MCKSYILYPEFDEQGRLHFHGMLHGYDRIKYFAWKYKLDRIGYTLVKPISEKTNANIGWVLYCQKGWRSTCKVFSNVGVKIVPLVKKNLRRKKEIIKYVEEPKVVNIYNFFQLVE